MSNYPEESIVCHPTYGLRPGAIATGTDTKALRRFSSQHGEPVAQRQDLRLERSLGSQSQSFLFKAFCGERVGDSLTVEQRTLAPSILVRIQVHQPYTSERISDSQGRQTPGCGSDEFNFAITPCRPP